MRVEWCKMHTKWRKFHSRGVCVFAIKKGFSMNEYDIEQFERLFKRCYPVAVYGRKNESGLFSFDDALEVFLVYFRDYKYFMKRRHPPLARGKVCAIIQSMDWVLSDESSDNGAIDLFPEYYPYIIRQHFLTRYRNCDYNICHFFSGKVRYYRYCETLK